VRLPSFRERIRIEEAKAAAAEAADPWRLTLERVRGKIDFFDGLERISSQTLLDLLEVPQRQRTAGTYRRLCKVMTELGWAAVRVRDLTRGGYKEQVRGYCREARSPQPARYSCPDCCSRLPYVIGKVVSRLEADSRWALARSVRALVAERDGLKEKLDGNFNSATGSGAA